MTNDRPLTGPEPEPTRLYEPTRLSEVPIQYTAELGAIDLPAPPPEFLPLGVRRVLFVVGLVALVAAPSVGVNFPEYAEAIETGGSLLAAVGLGVALANPTRRV